MSESCNHNCESCGQECSSRTSPQSFQAAPHPLSHVKKVIGVVSGKGGVGKSLTTALMAVAMNRKGYSSAVLDADVTGPSIPRVFGVKGRATGNDEGLFPSKTRTGIEIMSVNLLLDSETDPVVWRGPVIANMVKQFWSDVIWSDVDFMFVDMPPGTGDVPLTVFQSLPVDGIIIVTSPQELVGMIVEKAVNMAKLMNIPIVGIVENMSYFVCPDCGKKLYVFGESHVQSIADHFSLPVLGRLPIDPAIAAACDEGRVEALQGDWLSAAVEAVEKL